MSTTHSFLTGSTQIITLPDPTTGLPVQQIVQSRHDPISGETIQVPIHSSVVPNSNVIQTIDPISGQAQLVQVVTDPSTGNTMQIPMNDGLQPNSVCFGTILQKHNACLFASFLLSSQQLSIF